MSGDKPRRFDMILLGCIHGGSRSWKMDVTIKLCWPEPEHWQAFTCSFFNHKYMLYWAWIFWSLEVLKGRQVLVLFWFIDVYGDLRLRHQGCSVCVFGGKQHYKCWIRLLFTRYSHQDIICFLFLLPIVAGRDAGYVRSTSDLVSRDCDSVILPSFWACIKRKSASAALIMASHFFWRLILLVRVFLCTATMINGSEFYQIWRIVGRKATLRGEMRELTSEPFRWRAMKPASKMEIHSDSCEMDSVQDGKSQNQLWSWRRPIGKET